MPHRHRSSAAGLASVYLMTISLLVCGEKLQAQAIPQPWSFAGADLTDSHAMLSSSGNTASPTQINPRTASKLALKWSFHTEGTVSATPTVEQGGLYVPDWAGMLYKIDPVAGTLIWSQSVSTYTKLNSVSRTSPAIGPNVIVIGDYTAHGGSNPGARVIAVNKTTGALAWVTIVDTSPDAYITGAPVIYGNMVYVGTASQQEAAGGQNPNYVPTFRGSMSAINLTTGAVVWKFYTVPPGYSGGGVWGSSPVVWLTGHYLIFGTGDNYSMPAAVSPCVVAAGSNRTAQAACLAANDYVDSLIALNVNTGALVWSRQMYGSDAWNYGCAYSYPDCPDPPGTDSDFASAPNLMWIPNFTGVPDDRGGTSANFLLGAGQKSSIYWALNPANGGLYWSTFIGKGGIVWGSALDLDDHNLAFVSLYNANLTTNILAGRNGVPVSWNGGAWGAMNITTGKMIWQIPSLGQDRTNPANPSTAQGGVTFTNRVIFAGSSSGYYVALDADSGLTCWTFNSGNTVAGSPAIFNETVYWGTGYKTSAGATMLYAFSVP